MRTADLQARIDNVAAAGPLKAWSVVVTILGDLCLTREDRIGAQTLTALVGRLGISPQACRTAIHRLKRDGWVESTRGGRRSYYRLSETGWERTEAVRERVYAPRIEPREAMLVVAPPSLSQGDLLGLLDDGAIALSPRVALANVGSAPAECLVATLGPGRVPDWVAEGLADAEIRRDYVALAQRVAAVDAAAAVDDLLGRTALRLVILHHFRRLCLRHSILADHLFGPGWAGTETRALIASALGSLARPALEKLEDAVR